MTDLVLGVVLIISPFVFGFSGNGGATRFCIIFGALELITAMSTHLAPTDEPTTKSGRTPQDNNVRNMPTWIAPRLPPPAKTNAVFSAVALMRGL